MIFIDQKVEKSKSYGEIIFRKFGILLFPGKRQSQILTKCYKAIDFFSKICYNILMSGNTFAPLFFVSLFVFLSAIFS